MGVDEINYYIITEGHSKQETFRTDKNLYIYVHTYFFYNTYVTKVCPIY